MKRKVMSPFTIIGLVMIIGYLIYEAIFKAIPDSIGIPLLIIAIIFIVVGNVLVRVHNKKIDDNNKYE
ncbi:hypothetical protein LJB88_00060 [Erysipelotrichaceae bacterium OttesenSCG-928-M19]|nr:hypothetical protein [Erysipelotrichaceae bacterium OttesenSCG-928-M19]